MKFIADCMLGRLARWLRVLGYDTAYDAFADDDDLLVRSAAEDRMLLTRDGPLVQRAPEGTCLHIDFDGLDDQMAQMVWVLGIRLDREPFTRCLNCNTPIQSLSREDAQGRVPEYIHEVQAHFYACPDCERVYWRGTHVDRMDERLQRIRNRVDAHFKEGTSGI